MTNIYFVRHAEPNYDNHNDAERELTAKGLEDRKLVTKFFEDKAVDIVLSSPYKRAIDTVREFADKYGYEIEKVDDFRERRVDSVWIEDFTSFTKKQWSDFDYKLLDGECLREVQSRNIKALEQVLNTYASKTIVVGSHGTALSTIINYYNNSFLYDDFERIKKKMPWIVHFKFNENNECVCIDYIDVFSE